MAEQRIKTEDIQPQMVISVDLGEERPRTGTVTTVLFRGTLDGKDAMVALDGSDVAFHVPVDADVVVISEP